MEDKKIPPLPEPMTEKELNHMVFENAPKMVQIGMLYGCPIWVDMTNRHEERFHMIKKFLQAAIETEKE
jgi:hypothetical protein